MLGILQETILNALLVLKSEATSYEIYEAMSERHSLPSVSVALDRMKKKGWITCRKGDPLPERGGKARLYFKITPAGRAALIESEKSRFTLNHLAQLRPSSVR